MMKETNPTRTRANVDEAEVEKFALLADTWWDPNGPLKTLHEINPLRFEFIRKFASPLTGKTVLDVGCGGGILSESLSAAGAEVLGIDLATESIAAARAHAKKNHLDLDYQVLDVAALAARVPSSFDIVTSMELLEHVPHPNAILKAIDTLVTPGGLVFLSTINKNLKSYLEAIVAAEYILSLLPKKTHRYEQFIPPATLARWGRGLGWELLGLEGFSYNPITRRYFATDNCEVNYLIAFKKGE